MSYTEFYIRASGGSNLNSGWTSSDVGGGSDSATYTSTAGNFDGTSIFTPTDGSTPASFIAVNDYVSLYNTGDTAARCVAKVTAVGAGVNGTVTVDTTIKYGTVPTVNSGSRALKAGGSWADLGILATNAVLNTGVIPQSTRVNMKAGTYANTTTARSSSIGGTTLLLGPWLRGYKTTPGDQDANNVAIAGTDIPAITFTTGSFAISAGGAARWMLSNLDFNGATLNPLLSVAAIGQVFYRVRVQNTAANSLSAAITSAGANITFAACYFKATTTAAQCITLTASPQFFVGCIITGGIIGVNEGVRTASFYACVFDSQAGDAIQCTTAISTVISCSFYAPGGNGVVWTGTPAGVCLILNSYFENVNQASKAAINNTSGTNTDFIRCIGNAYYNCTANRAGLTEDFTIFDNGTLASAGFVNPGSQDFDMAAVGQGIGFPGKFENTSVYQGYLDVGAVEHQATGGGGMLVNPRKTGGKQ